MTYSEAKRWLSRGYRIKERIGAKARRIQNWYDLATTITSALKDVAVAPSEPGRKVERYVTEIVDMQNTIEEEIAELKETELEIACALPKYVDVPNYLTVLEMRYTAYMRWEEIADAMGITLRWTMTLHERAVRYFAEKAL